MTQHDLLNLIEEGLENGRLSPSLAAFIAADLLGVEPEETGYGEWTGVPGDEEDVLVGIEA